MTTMIFSIQLSDFEEIPDLKMLLSALPQNEIDLQSIDHGANYEKLYHLRNLRLEDLAGQLLLEGALDNSYLDILRQIDHLDSETKDRIRLAASTCEATEIPRHLAGFQSLANILGLGTHPDLLRMSLIFSRAVGRVVALVEITDPATGCRFKEISTKSLEPQFDEIEVSTISSSENSDPKESAESVLQRSLENALVGKTEPVNLGIYPHVSITQALHSFIYAQNGKVSVQLPIGYSDGSQARSFPFYSLIKQFVPASFVNLPVFKVGMVSARHPEMDHIIDFYWFRNQTVSVTRTTAQTDEVAYLWSKELLAKAKNQGPLRMAFFQTGFPPAVIGFYRAVIEELLESRKTGNLWLEVTPHFYNKRLDSYSPAETWL